MFAIVKDRGHQYKVTTGAKVTVDRSAAAVGETVELPVLVYSDGDNTEIGAPYTGKKAVCKVVSHGRGAKGIAGKFKRRKDSRRRVGFRHDQTTLEVVSID